jgi:hypothetical protein
MPFFKDSEQLYAVARELLTRVQEEMPGASDSIARSRLVIRLATTDPVTEFTLNGRKRPVEVLYGPMHLRPTLDLTLKADTLHGILLDEISLTSAVSSGLVQARGPVFRLVVLADFFRAGRRIYPQVLRDQGLMSDTNSI